MWELKPHEPKMQPLKNRDLNTILCPTDCTILLAGRWSLVGPGGGKLGSGHCWICHEICVNMGGYTFPDFSLKPQFLLL